ncbi:MAG: NepR family anti-sigma factor [Caulobacterales bacterium]
MKAPRDRTRAFDEARLRQQAIGAKLRQMFEDVVNDPVPESLLEILREADRRGAVDVNEEPSGEPQ